MFDFIYHIKVCEWMKYVVLTKYTHCGNLLSFTACSVSMVLRHTSKYYISESKSVAFQFNNFSFVHGFVVSI